MKYLDEAEEILTEIVDRRSLAVAILQKGVLYRCLGMNERSKIYLRNGIAIMEEIGDRIGQARGRSQLAFAHIATGELREALRESLMALRIAREARDVRAQIIFLNNIAYGAYRAVGDFKRAASAVLEAIRLATEGAEEENTATYYDTMAAVLLDQGRFEEAFVWAKQAQALYRTWENHSNYVALDIDYRLGTACLHLGQYSRSRVLLLKTLRRWERGGDLELQSHGVAALGLLHLRRNDREGALECAREIERLMRKMDGVEQAQSIFWAQYRIFRRLGMDAAARRALSRAHASIQYQSARLKGRFRRSFNAIRINREVTSETSGLNIEPGRAAYLGRASSLLVQEVWRDKSMRVEGRRRTLVALMAGGATDQNQLAHHLGVSPRTIRHDLSILRSQGFLRDLLPRRGGAR